MIYQASCCWELQQWSACSFPFQTRKGFSLVMCCSHINGYWLHFWVVTYLIFFLLKYFREGRKSIGSCSVISICNLMFTAVLDSEHLSSWFFFFLCALSTILWKCCLSPLSREQNYCYCPLNSSLWSRVLRLLPGGPTSYSSPPWSHTHNSIVCRLSLAQEESVKSS